MSLKRNFFSAITMAVAIAGFSVIASAQDNTTATPKTDTEKQERLDRRGFGRHGFGKEGMSGEGRHGGRMMHMLRGIELTDAQKTQIHTIMESNKPDQATMDELRTLGEAKRSGTLTADQQERFKSLRQQGRAKAEAIHSQILAILTPEQRQQVEQRKQEMKQRWEERRQMRQQQGDKPATDRSTDN